MNRHIRRARNRDLPIIDLWYTGRGVGDAGPPRPPDIQATRIWMAAAPADDTGPDYACVVAELYDGDPMQRDRKRLMLDESVGLDPADWTAEERELHHIRPHVEAANGRQCGCAVCSPTLGEFRRGLVALKDLYEPEIIMVPGQGLDSESYQREFAVNKFFRTVVMTDGLQQYDSRYRDEYERWCPCKRGDGYTVGVVTVREDEIFDKRIVENHLNADLFQYIAETCRLFSTRPHWRPPVRALQMLLAQMQDRDLTYAIRDNRLDEPGYVRDEQAALRRSKEYERALDEEVAAALSMMGGTELALAYEGALGDDGGDDAPLNEVPI